MIPIKDETDVTNRVATDIFHLIRQPSIVVFFSWGGYKFESTIFEGKPALQFRTHGFLHKGKVIVAFNEGMDSYEVYLIKRNGELKESMIDVESDELQHVIDSLVETEDANSQEYKDKVAKERCSIKDKTPHNKRELRGG